MSYLFSHGYRTPLNTQVLNDKIDQIMGKNGVFKGFAIAEKSGTTIKITNAGSPQNRGEAIVKGCVVIYYFSPGETEIELNLPATDGTYYIYGLHHYYEKSFSFNYTTIENDAVGDRKVFLGHVKIAGGAITEVQPLVAPYETTHTANYRRIPSIADAFTFLYESNTVITGDVEEALKKFKEEILDIIKKLNDRIDKFEEEFLKKIELENLAKRHMQDVNSYTVSCFQVAKYENKLASDVKRLRIKLPTNIFGGQSVLLTLQGINQKSGKSFTLILGGVLSSTLNKWTHTSAYALGSCNFSNVTFGRSSDDNFGIFISLGGNDVDWGQTSLILKDVLINNESKITNTKIWRDQWNIELIDSATIPGMSSSETTPVKTGGPQEGDYVASTTSVKAGLGLTGGGTLNKDVSIGVDFGNGVDQVSRGNHNHDGDYVKNTFTGDTARDKIVYIDNSNKVTFYPGVPAGKLEYIKNLNSDIIELLNAKSNSDHKHDSLYLSLKGGTVDGNVVVKGDLKPDTLYIDGRKVVASTTTPTTKVDKMFWIKCYK